MAGCLTVICDDFITVTNFLFAHATLSTNVHTHSQWPSGNQLIINKILKFNKKMKTESL